VYGYRRSSENKNQLVIDETAAVVVKEIYVMKATGIVRRIDDLGRVVIPKEIRRTMRIREGDPSHTTLTLFDRFYFALHSLAEEIKAR